MNKAAKFEGPTPSAIELQRAFDSVAYPFPVGESEAIAAALAGLTHEGLTAAE